MVTVSDILKFIDELAPFCTAMDFDNVGILVGNSQSEVSKCLVALDVTKDVIEEAKNLDANLIVSHHPVIFDPIKKLSSNSIPYLLAQADISVICAHTNFDMSDFGVNTCLAQALLLKDVIALSFYKSKNIELPIGLIGTLQKVYDCDEFAEFVKKKLNCFGLRYTSTNRKIKRVAISSGAGGNLIHEVIGKNVDAFITGEIKHHEILIAAQNDICLVDAGHFKTEDIAMMPLVYKLSEKFSSVEFIKSSMCTDKIKYIV